MDAVAVRAVAEDFGAAGDRLRTVVTEVEAALASSWWQGGDADAFRSTWTSRQRVTLHDVASRLREMRAALLRQAHDQEIASGVGPGSLGATSTANLFGPLADLGPVLRELGGDALDWVEWLAGPEGPSVEDVTRLVPGLQRALGDAMDLLMIHGGPVSDLITRLFGFEYVDGPDGGYYTTNEHSMQSHLGFHDLFDMLHKLGGMDLDDQVMQFEANGVEYRLELWRGGYGSGGAFGGEIGLYTRREDEPWPRGLLQLVPGFYSAADEQDQIRMTQTIYNTETGEVYFTNDNQGSEDGTHYWNLAIQTDPTVPHEDLGQMGTLYVTDEVVRREMVAALEANDEVTDVRVNPDGSVSYAWA